MENKSLYLTPFQRKLLQKSLQEDLPSQYSLRINIMLLADRGQSQTQICKALECSPATARHWISMARSGQAHNWEDNPIGRPKSINEQFLKRLKELVSQSPKDFGYPFRSWTAQWLAKHLAKEFDIQVTDRYINQLLRQMGLSTRSKPVALKPATNQSHTATHIAILDLESSRVPEFPGFLPFNSIG